MPINPTLVNSIRQSADNLSDDASTNNAPQIVQQLASPFAPAGPPVDVYSAKVRRYQESKLGGAAKKQKDFQTSIQALSNAYRSRNELRDLRASQLYDQRFPMGPNKYYSTQADRDKAARRQGPKLLKE